MRDAKHFGKAALDRLYRGQVEAGPGLLFLDFDEIICLSRPYGAYELFDAESQPIDLFEKLWHPPSKAVLLSIMEEHSPRVVITTSWLRLMERGGFVDLFSRTGLDSVAAALHEHWDAPTNAGKTRHDAIERWLFAHHASEPVIVLDDEISGTGLRGSKLDKLGRVVWCEAGVGLHEDHLPQVRQALAGDQS
ncbi:hypothetical protein KGA65_20730 [Ideonella sp. B7]|uniref:HAD domain-containing protein n=1 Tax=Ideonella benzenivorans TaxID=2831643 RepID=UPI001CED7AF3|nr:HAD domain-containing protein [Ideonella benzenivorans]MCA6218975.1 hypothetical protein [Ideonella benzenivorans]